ncbi:MAG: menaquinone via futalosine step 1 [Campylobacteraceae bacterium]|nr:menaquinone via futalosine step 1 [Campylobacteraceae bacterium]
MTFGKIDYINLLPFHIFLKKASLSNSFKQSIAYKKGYPSKLNDALKSRQIDAAYISSIASTRKSFRTIKSGIVAKKAVKSVILKKGAYAQDIHSATSNVLAKVLGFNGKVTIGDSALKLYLENPNGYIDMGAAWYEKERLPFVFARLSVNKNHRFFKQIADKFKKQKIFIPQYILEDYSQKRGISKGDIKEYLKLITYDIDTKAQAGLDRFLRAARLKRL